MDNHGHDNKNPFTDNIRNIAVNQEDIIELNDKINDFKQELNVVNIKFTNLTNCKIY